MLGAKGAITISIVFCGVFYLAMGFCGYIKYGLDTKPSISLNLPSGNRLAQTCQAMFALAVSLLLVRSPVLCHYGHHTAQLYQDLCL